MRRKRSRDGEAIVSRHEQRRVTSRELDEATDRLAAGRLRIGLKRGDRVAIWSPNSNSWTLLQFATAPTGRVFVTFNTAYRRSELEDVLKLSGARFAHVQFPNASHAGFHSASESNCKSKERDAAPRFEKMPLTAQCILFTEKNGASDARQPEEQYS